MILADERLYLLSTPPPHGPRNPIPFQPMAYLAYHPAAATISLGETRKGDEVLRRGRKLELSPWPVECQQSYPKMPTARQPPAPRLSVATVDPRNPAPGGDSEVRQLCCRILLGEITPVCFGRPVSVFIRVNAHGCTEIEELA